MDCTLDVTGNVLVARIDGRVDESTWQAFGTALSGAVAKASETGAAKLSSTSPGSPTCRRAAYASLISLALRSIAALPLASLTRAIWADAGDAAASAKVPKTKDARSM